jgi:putative oxidoreductase
MNTGLLLLHVFVGLALVAHGLQKLVVFRVTGTAAYLEGLGLRAPRLLAVAVIGAELAGGGLLALGLLLPLAAATVAGTMLVAARTDHRGKGWWITSAGAEYVVTNATVALALAAIGGGRYSLDRALSLDVTGAVWGVAAAAGAVVGAVCVLGTFARRPAGAVG